MHLLDIFFFDNITQLYLNSAVRGFNIRLFTFFILAVGLTNYFACMSLTIRKTYNPEGQRFESSPRTQLLDNRKYFLKTSFYFLLFDFFRQNLSFWVRCPQMYRLGGTIFPMWGLAFYKSKNSYIPSQLFGTRTDTFQQTFLDLPLHMPAIFLSCKNCLCQHCFY